MASLQMYLISEAPTFLNTLQYLFTKAKLSWMHWRHKVAEENICIILGFIIFPWQIVFLCLHVSLTIATSKKSMSQWCQVMGYVRM